MPERLAAGLEKLHQAVVEESNKLDALNVRLDGFITAEEVTDRVTGLERTEGRRRWRDRAAVLVLVVSLFAVNRAGVIDACHRDNQTRSGVRATLLRALNVVETSPGLTDERRRDAAAFYRQALTDVRPTACRWVPRL